MAGETFASERCQSYAHATASLAHRPLDRDVSSLLEGGKLLRQGRVGESELVADKCELGPVGGGEKGHDRQSRRRMDQLVEPVALAHFDAAPRARARIAAITRGPPRRIITATSTLAIVPGCSAPSAYAANPAATVTPASAIRKPKTITGAALPATSARTLTPVVRRGPPSSRCETAECTAPKVTVATATTQAFATVFHTARTMHLHASA